jgi:sulfite reductase beta subunit-like hemoprotein
VRERLDEMQITDPLTRKLHIKMSGCPNGCSQHHIANIGFYGASIKAGGHTIPAYVAHIAGNYDGGEIVYGQRLKVRLPAKRVPEAVERWIRLYEADRTDGEEFNAFAARVGTTSFEDAVRDLALPVEFGLDTMEHFIDWDRKVPFVVQRGEGECAV